MFLQLTDSVRDDVMPELGVKVRDDDPSFPYIYVDKATLLKYATAPSTAIFLSY